MDVYFTNGFSLCFLSTFVYGSLILIAIGYFALRSFRFLKLLLTGQNRGLYDFIKALKFHYARNEITDEELIRMKNILLQSG